MKRKILFCLFLLLAFYAFAENLSYYIDGRKKTVDAEYIGTQETRLFIQGGFLRESWIVIEKCFWDASTKKWSAWEKFNEIPMPKASNSDLLELVNEFIGSVVEDEINGQQILLVHTKNDNNQEYWWEERKYICFIQMIYIIN
jgi:hypothetical protein